MQLNESNYFSKENNMKYMGSSQFKSFCACESMAMAEINGEYEREVTPALLIGSYIDNHFSNSLDLFKAQHPEICLKNGELKSEYRNANYMIERIERDPMMMRYLSGEQQVIKTGEIEGVPFKIKIDSFHQGKAIVDLKTIKSFEPIWRDGLKLSFVEYWQIDIQMAIYQHIAGGGLPVFLATITKEKEPDIAIISIPQERLDYCMEIIKANVKRFDDIKKMLIEPTRCGSCNYCRKTKVLSSIFDYQDLG